MLESKFVKFLWILKWKVNSSLNFTSFFIVITHKSSVNFKLKYFLLWTKGPHQSPNFDTFKWSDENLPNSPCHFPNHKSVLLQILYHSSVSWKITPLYFFSSKNIYFAQKEHIKVNTFETFKCSSQKFVKFPMSILKRQVNSSSNFALFFMIMTHNSFVNFKLLLFLLWIKGPHQTPNFETFKYSGEHFPYSSFYFPSPKSVFLEILDHSSLSWKITLLYFLGQVLNTLHNRNQWEFKFLILLSAKVKIHQILVIFETKNQFSSNFTLIFSHETWMLCSFLAEIFIYF